MMAMVAAPGGLKRLKAHSSIKTKLLRNEKLSCPRSFSRCVLCPTPFLYVISAPLNSLDVFGTTAPLHLLSYIYIFIIKLSLVHMRCSCGAVRCSCGAVASSGALACTFKLY